MIAAVWFQCDFQRCSTILQSMVEWIGWPTLGCSFLCCHSSRQLKQVIMTQFWVHNKICVGRWQYFLSHVLHTKGCLVLVDLSKQTWPHSLIELFCPYIWIYTLLIHRQCGICLSNLHMKQTLENAIAQAIEWMFLSCCFMCFGGTLTCTDDIDGVS